MKTPRTRKDIQNDPRIDSITQNSALKGDAPWCALSARPYLFFGECRSALGTIREIIEDMESLEECPETWYE